MKDVPIDAIDVPQTPARLVVTKHCAGLVGGRDDGAAAGFIT